MEIEFEIFEYSVSNEKRKLRKNINIEFNLLYGSFDILTENSLNVKKKIGSIVQQR